MKNIKLVMPLKLLYEKVLKKTLENLNMKQQRLKQQMPKPEKVGIHLLKCVLIEI
jgi:hypothetical protein